ncbi:MAG: tetratricopeptide repeat protein [Planctomycetota bacterium]|nr:tetratricopeptide repeat protein [Planctomycetota bacterium]
MTRSDLDTMDAKVRARNLAMLGVVVIVVLTALAYSRVPFFDFIWDDESYVTNQSVLRDLDGLKRLWIPKETPQYYPVVFTSFWIEYQLWGLNASGYHVVNVILHILNALLLWMVCRKIGLPSTASWLIGALFALHPVHVESVAWITERKNVLSGFFYLASAWAYLHFQGLRDGEIESESSKQAWGWYGLAILGFVFALLSKSVTCSLPAALILVMTYQRKQFSVSRLLPLAPMFAIGLLAAINTSIIEREHVGAQGAVFDHTLPEKFLIASKALLFYPGKIIWPQPLMFIYPRWDIVATNMVGWWSVLVVALIGIGLIVLYCKGKRGPFIAMAFFAGTVFPAIGFFKVYPHQFSYVADHFQYLASIGVIALFVMLANHWIKEPKKLLMIAAAPLLAFSILTWSQSGDYANLEFLWRSSLAKNPDAWMAHNNTSSILLRRAESRQLNGEPADELIEEARHHAERALEINPGLHTAHSNLSEALRLQKNYAEALHHITRAAEEKPPWYEHHWQQGRLFELTSDPEGAIEAYRRTIELAPMHASAWLDLARVLVQAQRLDEAATEYEAILELQPSNFTALGTLANIRAEQERFAEAESLYDQSLQAALRPQDQVQIAMRLAILLMQCPDDSVRNPDKAIFLGQQVVKATQGNLPNTLDVLALAYAAGDRFEDAIATGQQALDLARQLNLEDAIPEYERRLEYYRRNELPDMAKPRQP